MVSPLHSAHGRVAVGAVVGAFTAAMFAVGVLNGAGNQLPVEDRAGVEPVPPGGQPSRTEAPVPTESSRPSASRSTTTTTTTTTSTTTKKKPKPREDPEPTQTEEPPPPPPEPPPTQTPPPTTTTTCSSLICVG